MTRYYYIGEVPMGILDYSITGSGASAADEKLFMYLYTSREQTTYTNGYAKMASYLNK